MSRETWNLRKQSKRFYVDTYRRASSILFSLMVINLSLGFAIYFTYFNRAERDFYATDGITAPVKLTPMSSPNYTSVALLASDPILQNKARLIPE